jgi:16S rRNA (guanine(966)-N(2))-methyltransferase RsmD
MLEGSYVLDLFAGSGQLGIEALSRGAEFAAFCESSKAASNIIEKNIEACHFEKDRFHLHKGDFSSFLRTTNLKFDFCFLDPPYAAGLYEPAFEGLKNVMKEDGIILCEHPKEIPLKDAYGPFVKVKDYRFSRIIISKYVYEDKK